MACQERMSEPERPCERVPRAPLSSFTGCPVLWRWGIWPDEVRPHHLVVLVLDDVAMPDVEARQVEQGLDPGDLARVGDDGVLEARLPAFRRSGSTVNRLAVDHLELHLVDVDGVRVLGEIVYLPDLDRTERRVLGDQIVPTQRDRFACAVERA